MTDPFVSRIESLIFTPRFSPDALLDALEAIPELSAHWSVNVGVHAVFTLRTHTLRVLDCHEQHFARRPQADPRSVGCFRLFLALHDIGKPLAIAAGDKNWQHRFTVDLLRRTRTAYPVTDVEFGDWIALVDGDPIGAYLKGDLPPRETGALIRTMAGRSSLSFGAFCHRLTVYYQCDASAYTRRGGLMNVLDDLFEWDARGEIAFDEQAGALRFSARVSEKLRALGREGYDPEVRS